MPRAARYAVGARAREEWQKFYFDILDDRNRQIVTGGLPRGPAG